MKGEKMKENDPYDFWHSLEGALDARAAEELLELISSLVLHYTDKTKRIMAFPGTMNYMLEYFDPLTGERKTTIIKLIPFFGLNAGYDPKLDVMIVSKPRY